MATTKFPEIVSRTERLYALRYWRYLLGWSTAAPVGYGISDVRKWAIHRIVRRDIRTTTTRPQRGLLLEFPPQRERIE
jgi:hypothetical protein